MLSNRSGVALIVKRRASKQLFLLLFIMHGLAMLMLWPLYEKLGLLTFLLMPILLSSFIWSVRCHISMATKYAVSEIVLKSSGEYVLGVGEGQYVSATLRHGSYVHPLLIILNFKTQQWPWYISVPLLSDSADKELLRRLRVRLRTMRDGELEALV